MSFTLFYNVGAAFITPDNKVELHLPALRRMLDERVKSGDFNEREREYLHAWQMFIRCYK